MKKRNISHKRVLSAKPNSVAEYIKYVRRSLFSILILGVFLSGCSGLLGEQVAPTASAAAEFSFEKHKIVMGPAKRQTVLTGFLLVGDVADLAVVDIDENSNRHLRIYAFSDNTWMPKLDLPLDPKVLFVDVVNIDGCDRLIMYEQGRVSWFDPESVTEHTLVMVTAMTPSLNGGIPHVDITHDVNGDVRDDLVVPDSDGFWVFIQIQGGTFADPMKLGPPTEMNRIYDSDEYRYTPWNQSRIHETDYNRDGRNDLVFWNEDHFEVHHQDEHGLFSPVATTFTTDVVFDSDELASLAAPYGIRRRRKDHQPMGDLTGRVLHAVKDMNGDGVTDLGVFSLEGGSLWHMHSTYQIHYGTPTPDGGTTFAPEISITIASDGIPFGLVQHDFDSDNRIDMMFTTFKPRTFKLIGMIIGSLLTGSVSWDLDFYRMEDGIYFDKPNTIRKIKTHSGESGEKTIFSPMLIGDVNGDRRSDLLVQQGSKELHVFLGVPGPKLLAKKPQKVAVLMPNDERNARLADLNKDNKQDVFMHYTSDTKQRQVILLIAR